MLCRKIYCQKGFHRILVSYKVTLRRRALARELLVDVHSEPLEKLRVEQLRQRVAIVRRLF